MAGVLWLENQKILMGLKKIKLFEKWGRKLSEGQKILIFTPSWKARRGTPASACRGMKVHVYRRKATSDDPDSCCRHLPLPPQLAASTNCEWESPKERYRVWSERYWRTEKEDRKFTRKWQKTCIFLACFIPIIPTDGAKTTQKWWKLDPSSRPADGHFVRNTHNYIFAVFYPILVTTKGFGAPHIFLEVPTAYLEGIRRMSGGCTRRVWRYSQRVLVVPAGSPRVSGLPPTKFWGRERQWVSREKPTRFRVWLRLVFGVACKFSK